MARNALLIWCAGSALVCGTAALAATTLWRSPAAQLDLSTATPTETAVSAESVAVAVAPAPIEQAIGGSSAEDRIGSLASVSFFDERAAGASSLFRGSLGAESRPAEAAAAPPLPEVPATFAEVSPATVSVISVLPPRRPKFQLARLDAKASLSEASPEQPAPGFEVPPPAPQTSPGWNWDSALRGKPQNERVLNAGIASWYGPGFHGRKTASGERFDQNDMTAAHKTLPFGSRVRVVDEKTGRSIVVRINDRGPFKPGRVIDLSKAAAAALGVGGLARVKLVSAN